MYEENENKINIAEITIKIVLIFVILAIAIFVAFKMDIIKPKKISEVKEKVISTFDLKEKTEKESTAKPKTDYNYTAESKSNFDEDEDWSIQYFEKYGITKHEGSKEDIPHNDAVKILSMIADREAEYEYMKSDLQDTITFRQLAYLMEHFNLLGSYPAKATAIDKVISQGIINSYCLTRDINAEEDNTIVNCDQLLAICSRLDELLVDVNSNIIKRSFYEVLGWY